jgi:hypothetical protein
MAVPGLDPGDVPAIHTLELWGVSYIGWGQERMSKRDLLNYPRAVLVAQYIQYAVEFSNAYKKLGTERPPSWPRYFLFCHAIELILKAFLWHTLGDELELNDWCYSHDIKKLFAAALRKGLTIDEDVREELELLSTAHEELWPRYPMTNAKEVFVIECFDNYLDRLIIQVNTAINPRII